MTEDQIKYMTDRFLSWKLPQTFGPDNGISFKPTPHAAQNPEAHWPRGTNLLDAAQAEAMIRHLVEGLPQ
jgi:hypothetical protein